MLGQGAAAAAAHSAVFFVLHVVGDVPAQKRQVSQGLGGVPLTSPCAHGGDAQGRKGALKVRLADSDVFDSELSQPVLHASQHFLIGRREDHDVHDVVRRRREAGFTCGVRDLGSQLAERHVFPHHDVVVEAAGSGLGPGLNRNRAR